MLSSSERHDRLAQIALLDAMVFFAIAMLMCAVQLSALEKDVRQLSWPEIMTGRSDPGCVLPVLLAASIGAETYVHADAPLLVPAHTPVSDCLAAEAISLLNGLGIEAFEGLNGIVLDIVSNLTHPLLTPHVLLHHHTKDGHVLLARIEGGPPRTGCDIAAASCELPGIDSETVTVSLMLEPALILEGSSI